MASAAIRLASVGLYFGGPVDNLIDIAYCGPVWRLAHYRDRANA